ncbi:hypothetical protein CRG98_038942 [Punica granatum]|uniref:Uncharacterized protein n=1 Tax=Punica granatum TaxID=22663 RepID=A0A2I0I9L1_PUNGR|nr:hypothetical protein CRG98_038942 [Punica granatum]
MGLGPTENCSTVSRLPWRPSTRVKTAARCLFCMRLGPIVLACRRPASLLKQLRDLLVGIALLGADFATGSIARCSCWKLVSLLKRLLAGDALVSPLGRLLAVLPEVGLVAGAFAEAVPRCSAWGDCSLLRPKRLLIRRLERLFIRYGPASCDAGLELWGSLRTPLDRGSESAVVLAVWLHQTARMVCLVAYCTRGRIYLGGLNCVEEPIGDRVGVDNLAISLGDP